MILLACEGGFPAAQTTQWRPAAETAYPEFEIVRAGKVVEAVLLHNCSMRWAKRANLAVVTTHK
jgi:hypothetical protein